MNGAVLGILCILVAAIPGFIIIQDQAGDIDALRVAYKELEDRYYQQAGSCDMRFPQYDNGTLVGGVNGLYQHPDYFCVWTNGRSREEIAGTTMHELAHWFVYNNKSHYEVKT